MLRMPLIYQPLDSKRNPRQHMSHSIETCNNIRIDGDLMVKQFIHFLKCNA